MERGSNVSDLTDFLLARIAEDEAAARACEPESERHPYGDRTIPATPFDRLGPEIEGYLGGSLGAHAARWHPARVLAECEAKRRIIDLAFVHMQFVDGELGCSHSADQIRNGRCADIDPAEDSLLRTLALPYESHPDYRSEWRP